VIDLRQMLQEFKEVEVTFVKRDGSLRTLRATLKDVQPYERKTDTIRPPRADNLVSVWSIDDEGWRTIDVDMIQTAIGQ